MDVDVKDIFNLTNELGNYNSLPLRELRFFRDGKLVDIPRDILDEWKFTGLSNVSFILDYEWPDED